MNQTILKARFTNRDHTSAEVITKDDGPVLASSERDPEFWSAVLAAKPTAFRVPFDPLMVKAECQRRIYAVVDQIAQVNLAAAAAGLVLTEEQMAVYRAGLAWIASMRTVCGSLIAASDRTFSDDRHWPAPDASIVALAEAF